MRLVITQSDVGHWAAKYIREQIQQFKPNAQRHFVLGLPTGGTPLQMYKNFVSMHKNGSLSFKHVTTFNMDEYIGLPEDHPESYHSYMQENLFRHVDIDQKNVHILDGNARDLDAECQSYNQRMAAMGGVDIFVGGVGENGHIAFNEPHCSLCSTTRVEHLDQSTRAANSRFFDNDINKVPTKALTIGMKELLDSRQVLILVSGPKKAQALKECMEGCISHSWPITALQMHQRAIIVADEAACAELKVKTYKYFQELEDQYSHIDKLQG